MSNSATKQTKGDPAAIISALQKGNEEEKNEILESLAETRDTSFILPLIQLLEQEKSRAVKERILLILDPLMAQDQFRQAERMLRSPDPSVRNGIVEIIKKHAIPIIQFLDKLADDPDKDVRKFVIDALSVEKSEDAIKIIRKRLDDPDINIRYTAIEYLGNFKDTTSVSHIEDALLKATHPMVLCSALEALAKIDESPRREEILTKFAGPEADPLVTFPMLKYLGAFGDIDSLAYARTLLENDPPIYTKEIIDAIQGIALRNDISQLPQPLLTSLETLMDKIDNNIDKYAIIKLVNRFGGDTLEQLERMEEMLNNPDDMLKLCAVEILGEIGGEEELELLEEMAENYESDEILEALGDAVAKIEERLSQEMQE